MAVRLVCTHVRQALQQAVVATGTCSPYRAATWLSLTVAICFTALIVGRALVESFRGSGNLGRAGSAAKRRPRGPRHGPTDFASPSHCDFTFAS